MGDPLVLAGGKIREMSSSCTRAGNFAPDSYMASLPAGTQATCAYVAPPRREARPVSVKFGSFALRPLISGVTPYTRPFTAVS